MTLHITNSPTLRDLIRTYQVSFTIQSSDVAICGRVAQATFHLKLRGYHDGKCGGAFCLGCNHVLRVLFEVADTLRPFEREAFKRAGYVYEKGAGCASGRGRDHREVVLGLRLTVRRAFAQASGGWGWQFMERISSALTKLGCHDRSTEMVPESRLCLGPVKVPSESSEAGVPLGTAGSESFLTV